MAENSVLRGPEGTEKTLRAVFRMIQRSTFDGAGKAAWGAGKNKNMKKAALPQTGKGRCLDRKNLKKGLTCHVRRGKGGNHDCLDRS